MPTTPTQHLVHAPRLLAVELILLAMSTLGCSDSATETGTPAPGLAPDIGTETGSTGDEPAEMCIPGGVALEQPETAREYVTMCEPELGVPPRFDCGAGVVVPITVDGVEVNEPVPEFTCDVPSLQIGECIPGSTINRVVGQTRDGTPRPEVVWVQFCRTEGAVFGGEFDLYTGAQMIGYNNETGATCFFESGDVERWVSRDDDYKANGVLPNYDEPEFDEAFSPAGDTQCVQCHQNNPFVTNPWLNGARLPDNPEETVLPLLAPDAPYYVIGGSDWDMRTLHIEGNACLSCHSIGMETDMLFRYNGFDANQWMPAHAPGSMAEDYAELLECWTAGPEQTEGCEWRVPAGGGCDARTVGAGYPFASPWFNFPRDDFYFGDEDEDEDGQELEDEACIDATECMETSCLPTDYDCARACGATNLEGASASTLETLVSCAETAGCGVTEVNCLYLSCFAELNAFIETCEDEE